MPARPQRRRPSYPVASADNALRLILMLRDLGVVRGRDAAAELGISPSSVHRLMSMLVFRGFAVQGESREYLPGPSIGIAPATIPGLRSLSEVVRPRLGELSQAIGETTYFMVLIGTEVRFLTSVESAIPLHAEDRHGFVLPAHASAAGRAILAHLGPSAVDQLYAEGSSLTADERERLEFELGRVRSRGYSLSMQEVETGIVSVAVPIRIADVTPPAAISMAGPPHRLAGITSSETLAQLFAARDGVERDIAAWREEASGARGD